MHCFECLNCHKIKEVKYKSKIGKYCDKQCFHEDEKNRIITWGNKISNSLKGQKWSENRKQNFTGKNNPMYGKKSWSNGLTKDTNNILKENSLKQSEFMLGKKYAEGSIRTEEVKDKLRKARKLQNSPMKGKKHSKKTIDILIEKTKELWKNPVYIEKQILSIVFGINNGWKHTKKGYFYSNKNNKELFYRSSYELKAYEILEDSIFVKNYNNCSFSIPYEFEDKIKRYIPDIMVEYITGIREIIEIKPSNLLTYKKNPFKFEALKNYGYINKLKISIWTEKELGIA